MQHSASKIIGKLVMLIGLGMCVYGGVVKEGIFGAIGGLVTLLGRFIDEYFDEWFGS
ncbi:MAG: hypothetical protein JJU34_01520 [Lunatimonas sp.]|uniref:hypothetical protein n=1 Tax=Lunatimonas sp. TaxID=2060141 RepID=UPI00263B1E47|nr:hypothetical protein [Lunatimonas sp.]MCC5935936.1 hypothetical protein [Lunatimonas sp.]